MDPAVHFVAQSIADAQSGGGFPGVLNVEIVGFAAHRGFIELVSLGRQAGGRGHGIGIGCRGEKAGERIRERISSMDIMLAAGGRNHDGRISSTPSEGVQPVGIRSKNRGIAVESQFRTPFEGMRASPIDQVVFELVDIPIGTEDGSVGRIEALKKTITEGHGRLGMVAGDENRRAANIAQSRLIAEVRSGGARIFYRGIALMIEEFHPKIRIHRGLIGVRGWPGDLIAAEAQKQGGFIRKSMIEPERSLIRIGDHFGRCGIGARAVSAVRIVRQRIPGDQRRDAAVHWNDQCIAGKSGGIDSLSL